MKIIIRDDDVNYFTEPEMIQEIYNKVWERNIQVYFGVIPFQKGEKSGQVPEKYWKSEKIFSVDKNKKLVDFIKRKIKEEKSKVLLHGYYHKSENGKPEFVGGENLTERVRKGKEYLEDLFSCKVEFFVPPHNKISKGGVRAVVKNNMGLFNIPDIFAQPLSSIPDYIKHRIFWKKYKLPYPYPLKLGKSFQIGCISVYKSAQIEEIKRIIEFYKKFPDATVCFAFHWWELAKFSHLREILDNITREKDESSYCI